MKTLPNLLFASLALLAAPVAAKAQDALPPRMPRVLELPLGRADCGFALLAVTRGEVRIADFAILAEAIVVPIARQPNRAAADLQVPRNMALWSQVITGADGGLAGTPIRRHPALDATADQREQPREEVLPLALTPSLVSGRYVAMKAAFTAPTDGYALKVLDVRAQDGIADVWLWRKLPNADEGHSRSQQELSVKAEFAPVRIVRVWLGEGAGAGAHGADADPRQFRQVGHFPQ